MDKGLTEAAWRVVSQVPLGQLGSGALERVALLAKSCRDGTGGAPPARGLYRVVVLRVENDVERLKVVAQRREQDELYEQRRATEQQESTRVREIVLKRLAELARIQDAKSVGEVCNPSVQNIAEELTRLGGSDLFRSQVATTNAWSTLASACTARSDRVRLAETKRTQEDLEGRSQKVRAAISMLVQRSVANHASKVKATVIPAAVLKLPVVLKLDPSSALFNFETSQLAGNIPDLSLEALLALFVEATPQLALSSATSRGSDEIAFAMKAPGEQTTFLSFQRDGDELFPSRLQLPDRTFVDLPSSGQMPLTAALVELSGLKQVIGPIFPEMPH